MTDRTCMSPHEVERVLDELRACYIESERDDEFERHFRRLFRHDDTGALTAAPILHTGGTETRGMLLIDAPGGGKNRLVNNALDSHVVFRRAGARGLPPCLSIRVPSPATLSSLGCAILEALKYGDVREGRRWSIWRTVRHRLAMFGISMLWIDEAHDLFHENSRREIEDMIATLKSLMQGPGAVSIVLTGTEKLWEIVGVDPQLSRRLTRLTFAPIDETMHGARLCEVIEDFCKRAGLSAPPEQDLVARLIHASRGRFGRCIERTIQAIEEALRNGDRCLDMQHFAEAFMLQEGCAPDRNVFLHPAWRQIDVDAPPVEPRGGGPRRR
ncbi:TniB family NTP-binding protein [Cereibacter azotoformans]|uniref:TniB family NTP-binding protein n=1 Tax=Cereibacter azotoformans TaxID=43057 RepID=UPI001EE9EE25|nr:TniB family NTP-binding protein [Cereibacter azotoformans]ULB11858.1 TniB family NTP-binding protein [Cereibacter azotoformans]